MAVAAYASGTLVPGGTGVNTTTAGSLNLNMGFNGQPVVEISVGGVPGNQFGANVLTVTISTDGGNTYRPTLVLDAVQNLYFNSAVPIATNDVRFFYLNTLGITNVLLVSSISSGAMPVTMASINSTTLVNNANQAMIISLLTMMVKGIGISVGEDLTTL
jgi:hypothetical protein